MCTHLKMILQSFINLDTVFHKLNIRNDRQYNYNQHINIKLMKYQVINFVCTKICLNFIVQGDYLLNLLIIIIFKKQQYYIILLTSFERLLYEKLS